jgi:hypothetical protein
MKRNSLIWALALCCGSCLADTYVDGVRVQEVKSGISYQQRVVSSVTNGFEVFTNLAYASVQVGMLSRTFYLSGTNEFGNVYSDISMSLANSTPDASTWEIKEQGSGASWTNNGVNNSIVDVYTLADGPSPNPTLNVYACVSNTTYVTNWDITILTNTVPVTSGTFLYFY